MCVQCPGRSLIMLDLYDRYRYIFGIIIGETSSTLFTLQFIIKMTKILLF